MNAPALLLSTALMAGLATPVQTPRAFAGFWSLQSSNFGRAGVNDCTDPGGAGCAVQLAIDLRGDTIIVAAKVSSQPH